VVVVGVLRVPVNEHAWLKQRESYYSNFLCGARGDMLH
jgi:hypothetical protein